MKNKYSKLVILLLVFSFILGLTANATTFEDDYGVPIHFYTTDIEFNQDNLDGIWNNLGDNGVAKWTYWGSPISKDEVSFSSSDLDFYTVDPSDLPTGAAGMAFMYDWDGTCWIVDPVSEFESSGIVFFARIKMSSLNGASISSTLKKAILGHEVGHVLGLAHPSSSESSIMSSTNTNSGWSTSVTSYDKSELESIY